MATSEQIKSITQQAQAIQSGINKLATAEKAGMKVGSNTTVQQAESYAGGSPQTTVERNADGSTYYNNFVSSNPADAPSPGSRRPTEDVATSTPTAPEASPYTVKPGDTLSGIAQAQGVDMSQISGYKSGDPNKIVPGEQLSLGQQYRNAANLAKQTGLPASQDAAGGMAGAGQFLQATAGPQAEPTTPQVDSFYLEDKNVKSQAQEIIDFLSPPSTQKMLMEGMKQIQSQQNQLAEDKVSLMNLENVMSGSALDIAKEIESSGGIGTSSLVASLAVARNSTLLKQASYLQNKISMQQDLIANSTQLLSFEKEMANTQFSQRMGVMQYVQQNNDRMRNAFTDSIKTIQQTTGWAGLKAAYASNPRQLSYVESLYGGAGSLDRLAMEEQRQALIVTPEQALKLENLNLQNQKLRKDVSGAGASGGKPISSATALNIADSNAAVSMLGDLRVGLETYSGLLGPVKGRINAANPYNTDAQYLQSLVNSTKQIVGKYLEGGVLRAEDEKKYEKILPKLSDTPSVAIEKLGNVQNLVESKIKAQQDTLTAAGYNPANVSGDTIVGPDGNEYIFTD